MTTRALPCLFLLVPILSLLAAPTTAQTVFRPPELYTATETLQGVAVGDVNEDGFLDVITAPADAFLFDPNFFQVFLGQGDGTLTLLGTFAFTAFTCYAMDLADRNDDGHLDIIAVCPDGNGQSVLIANGDGSGTFGPAVQSQGATNGDALVVGEISTDGFPDWATSSPGFSPFFPPEIKVRVSNGPASGQLKDLTPVALPVALAIGDVAASANGDLVVAGVDGTLTTFINNGGATFSGPVNTATRTTPVDIVLLPLDGDDKLDLVLTDAATDRVISYLNNGNGTWTQAGSTAAGLNPRTMTTGDLDGDTLPDVVVASTGSDDIHVLRNLGDGTLERIVSVSNVEQPAIPRLGDLDGDGDPEIVVGNLAVAPGVSVLLNHTYADDSPYLDLGQALFGTNGYPIQLCEGTLEGGSLVSWEVYNALPDGIAFLVFGLSAINAPFKQGVMVPAIDAFIKPIFIDTNGEFVIAGIWGPGLPAGIQFWMQYWFQDAGGPANFGGTNAVRATTP